MYQRLGDRVVFNDDVFEWSELPRRGALVGAGVIGLGLGQARSRLGVDVTMDGPCGRVSPLIAPVTVDYEHDVSSEAFRF
ncbi:pyruvate/2-oxoglutarate dehydrogenase complex dihydrolipoamide dehydrogenase (E3) component [Paraburkholderia sp. GAS334]